MAKGACLFYPWTPKRFLRHANRQKRGLASSFKSEIKGAVSMQFLFDLLENIEKLFKKQIPVVVVVDIKSNNGQQWSSYYTKVPVSKLTSSHALTRFLSFSFFFLAKSRTVVALK